METPASDKGSVSTWYVFPFSKEDNGKSNDNLFHAIICWRVKNKWFLKASGILRRGEEVYWLFKPMKLLLDKQYT